GLAEGAVGVTDVLHHRVLVLVGPAHARIDAEPVADVAGPVGVGRDAFRVHYALVVAEAQVEEVVENLAAGFAVEPVEADPSARAWSRRPPPGGLPPASQFACNSGVSWSSLETALASAVLPGVASKSMLVSVSDSRLASTYLNDQSSFILKFAVTDAPLRVVS